MSENESGSAVTGTLVFIFFFLLLASIAVGVFLALSNPLWQQSRQPETSRQSTDPAQPVQQVPTATLIPRREVQVQPPEQIDQNEQPQSIANPDINDDGTINAFDSIYVQENIGCSSVDPCWQTVVGETLSGSNPIYVFDLDLNQDDVINEADLAFYE